MTTTMKKPTHMVHLKGWANPTPLVLWDENPSSVWGYLIDTRWVQLQRIRRRNILSIEEIK